VPPPCVAAVGMGRYKTCSHARTYQTGEIQRVGVAGSTRLSGGARSLADTPGGGFPVRGALSTCGKIRAIRLAPLVATAGVDRDEDSKKNEQEQKHTLGRFLRRACSQTSD